MAVLTNSQVLLLGNVRNADSWASTPDLQIQNPHFNKIPTGAANISKFKKNCFRVPMVLTLLFEGSKVLIPGVGPFR